MKHLPQPIVRVWLAWIAVCLYSCSFPSLASGSSLRNSAIVRAVKAARPSVVNIHGHKTISTTTAGYPGSEATRKVNGMGTGVVVDPRGYIITNHHVVEGVREIRVTLYDGKSYIGRLVAHDPQTDLAVIKIPTKQRLPLINIGTSQDLMEGEEVIAVGNAYGYENTVTRGIISALHRTVQVTDTQQYRDLIQTDASINPGNSGGPLLNIDGEMIGINVAVRVGAQGIGFAIPVDRAMDVAARLLSAERVGGIWHGVVPQLRGPAIGGVVAQAVQTDSPAARAGIRSGDVIKQVNSLPIQRPLDVERAMIGLRPGQQVQFELVRNGQTHQVPLELVAASRQTSGSPREVAFEQAWQSFGIRLEAVPSPQLAGVNGQFAGGLRVLEVRPGSPADLEGVVAGDVLVGLHEWVTASPNDLAYIMASSQVRQVDSVKFYIVRGQDTLFGHLPVVWRR
jgi:serine protease Do